VDIGGDVVTAAETPEGHRVTRRRRLPKVAPRRTARTCEAPKLDGTPCRSFARTGRPFCLSHDPEFREELLKASRRGGIASHQRQCVPTGEPEIELRTAEDIRKCISGAVDKLAKGTIDRAVANGIMYGCQIALRAIDVAELERRIAALEEARRPKGKGR